MLARFIQDNYGIKIHDGKKLMLESRLRKRLKETRHKTFTNYLDFVFSPAGMGSELVPMIDSVTTNKTLFFREPDHFKLMANSVIPQFIALRTFQVNIWSAACSTGEEPYTLAMVMADAAEKNSRLTYTILASDLSTHVLKKAYQAVYQKEEIRDIPTQFRKKYLLKSSDKSMELYRIDKPLRERVTFRRINLMTHDFNISKPIHVIFCRNALIYFPKDRQERLIKKFYRMLEPGGYLFIGHSESIIGMDIPFFQVVPTVYRKGGGG